MCQSHFWQEKLFPFFSLSSLLTFSADDQKEACFGYVDRLDEVSDLYRKEEARNGCVLQKLTCSLALNI